MLYVFIIVGEGNLSEEQSVIVGWQKVEDQLHITPKFSKPLKSKPHAYVSEFGAHVFSTDGTVLLCKACEKTVTHEKKYFISQHVSTKKHISALASKSDEKKMTLLSTAFATFSKQWQFSLDLCKTLIDAGIPFWKLENQSLKKFLQKYTGEPVPRESTLRKKLLACMLWKYNSTHSQWSKWQKKSGSPVIKPRIAGKNILPT